VRIEEIKPTSAGRIFHCRPGTQNNVKSLNHERKLYMDQPTPAAPAMKALLYLSVKKGQKCKELQGYKCVE